MGSAKTSKSKRSRRSARSEGGIGIRNFNRAIGPGYLYLKEAMRIENYLKIKQPKLSINSSKKKTYTINNGTSSNTLYNTNNKDYTLNNHNSINQAKTTSNLPFLYKSHIFKQKEEKMVNNMCDKLNPYSTVFANKLLSVTGLKLGIKGFSFGVPLLKTRTIKNGIGSNTYMMPNSMKKGPFKIKLNEENKCEEKNNFNNEINKNDLNDIDDELDKKCRTNQKDFHKFRKDIAEVGVEDEEDHEDNVKYN